MPPAGSARFLHDRAFMDLLIPAPTREARSAQRRPRKG
jgi:hypothetical protein